jgi:hydrogenase/urease accessory protein HupE
MFQVYLELGYDHILDLKGYDHILFLIALCAVFAIEDWKKVLILVTAFTIGHSFTLALSALHMVTVSASLIELLIPITILITALLNLWYKPDSYQGWKLNYLMALFFGFIHGMGFSNYFKALLGKEADILLPLFAFNVGVELGQLCIVAGILLIHLLAVKGARMQQKFWNITVSVVAAVLAIQMIIEKI